MEKNKTPKEKKILTSTSKSLSQRKRVFLSFIFILGIPLSYPTVMPLGLICASILLFQKNKKANLMGLLLVIVEFLCLFLLVGINLLTHAI